MAYFKYRALNKSSNRIVNGKMEAPSEFALEQLLNENNLILISARELVSRRIFAFIQSKVTNKDLITLFMTMEQLERAGVGLLDSLKDIKDSTSNQSLKDIMQNIYEAVKSGSLLSEALAKYPKIFDEVMISLVAMGEKTGNLDESLKNIYENLKWSHEIKRKTVKALSMPLFSLTVMIGAAAILLKVVVPKVLAFIIEQEIEVPVYTNWLIATSDFVQAKFVYFIAVPAGLFFLIKLASRNNNVATAVDFIKLKIPLLGEIMLKLNISRFTKFFGMTYGAGIPILDCISIANNVINNKAIKADIQNIRQEVSDGQTLSSCIEGSPFFPSIVVRMFKVGEESGNIEEAMENVQYFYDMEINDSIERIIATIQPTILFVMGGLMGWIVLAVFGPIYGNFSNMV